MAPRSKTPKKPRKGTKDERLKIEGDWADAVRRALKAPKAPAKSNPATRRSS